MAVVGCEASFAVTSVEHDTLDVAVGSSVAVNKSDTNEPSCRSPLSPRELISMLVRRNLALCHRLHVWCNI